jgi:sulfate adenylyltransferase
MGKADFDGVVADMRLADGTLWPIPITLDVPESLARELRDGSMLASGTRKSVLAALRVDECFSPISGSKGRLRH